MTEKENQDIKYYLGVDWGQKRCGLAIADRETGIASSRGECDESLLIQTVNDINKETPLKSVIFGFSEVIKNDDCQSEMDNVIGRLKDAGFDIRKEEEMFSTLLAQRNLLEAEKSNVSKEDNAESARIILQGWIDKKL